MQKPVFTGDITPETVAAAQSAGLPVINGSQVLASIRVMKPGQTAVSWYYLENGTEWIADDQGNTVGWPS